MRFLKFFLLSGLFAQFGTAALFIQPVRQPEWDIGLLLLTACVGVGIALLVFRAHNPCFSDRENSKYAVAIVLGHCISSTGASLAAYFIVNSDVAPRNLVMALSLLLLWAGWRIHLWGVTRWEPAKAEFLARNPPPVRPVSPPEADNGTSPSVRFAPFAAATVLCAIFVVPVVIFWAYASAFRGAKAQELVQTLLPVAGGIVALAFVIAAVLVIADKRETKRAARIGRGTLCVLAVMLGPALASPGLCAATTFFSAFSLLMLFPLALLAFIGWILYRWGVTNAERWSIWQSPALVEGRQMPATASPSDDITAGRK